MLLTVPQVVTDVQTILNAIVTGLPITTLALIIGAVLSAGLGYVVFWFGVKYAIPRLMSALKRGKIRA